MTDSLFQQAATTESNTTTETTPVVHDHTEFVGEGKKYKTQEEALASIPHAQAHIKKLEDENARLASENAKSTQVDALLSKLEEQQQTTSAAATQATPTQQQANIEQETKPLADTVSEIVKQLRVDEQAKANYALVEAKLLEKFGNESANVLKKLSGDVGMSIDDLQDLAQRSPNALFAMLPSTAAAQTFAGASTGTVTATAKESFIGSDRTFAYYEKLRKQDSKTYWSSGTQAALHADALKLGDSFYAS